MTLGYSYIRHFSDNDRLADDRRVERNRQEAIQGARFALAIYSAYSLSAADASDSCPNPNQGGSAPEPTPGNQVAPSPGLTEGQKGGFTGSPTGIWYLTSG